MHTDTEHVEIPQHKNFKTVQLTLNHKPRELKGEKTETKTKIKKKTTKPPCPATWYQN